MRVFVTGATGYIGSAVAAAFARTGHEVFGLARSPEKASRLAASEVQPVFGALDEPASYRDAASSCQILIHCAAEPSARHWDLHKLTLETLLDVAVLSRRPRKLIATSGVWVYGDTGESLVDESSPLDPPLFVNPRPDADDSVLKANGGNVSTLVIRPGCVYGGAGGLTGDWFKTASEEGAARIVGDGGFRWSMVHVQDLADLYVRAAESLLSGEIFNATDRSRFTVLECARAASQAAGASGRVEPLPLREAARTLGPYAECLTLNQHVDSSKAVRLLRWTPRHGGFVDGAARYFAAWKAAAGG